jgi:GDP-4-dehydro-6-deoxy-D-mannose reductase
MRVAITGASGFLGAHLVAELSGRGHSTLRVRREASGGLVPPGEQERADALVHLAFPTDAAARRAKPLATLRAVVLGAADALAIAEQLSATHVLLASTGKVYGFPGALPITDHATPRPTTQLGELKLLAEGVLASGARGAGLGATTLRIFNAYGPGQDERFLVPTVLAGIARGELSLGELDHARDWIHASDVARAVACALGSPPPAGHARVWNVASGESHSVRDMLDLLRRAGARVPEPVVASSKLRAREAPEERAAAESLRALGWSPRVALDEGLADLLVQRGLAADLVSQPPSLPTAPAPLGCAP